MLCISFNKIHATKYMQAYIFIFVVFLFSFICVQIELEILLQKVSFTCRFP